MAGSVHHTGVILAAGRGSRLGDHTAQRPKCLVELAGRALLDWQQAALAEAGITDVAVVTGYRHDDIVARGVTTIHNDAWAGSNMVASLLTAFDNVAPPYIISYSDIVYPADHITRLLGASGDLAITYDTDWADLWRRRFTDPLSDAETFSLDREGLVDSIGGRPAAVDEVEGQFMGLFRISAVARAWIIDLIERNPGVRAKLDSTGLLSMLIAERKPVVGVPITGGWTEIDDEADLAVAHALLAEGLLQRPVGV